MPNLPNTVFLVVTICVTLIFAACRPARDLGDDIAPPDPEVPARPVEDASSTSEEQTVASSNSVAVIADETVEAAEDAALKTISNESQETHENSAVETTAIEVSEESGGIGLPGKPVELEPDEDNAEKMKNYSINELSSLLNLHPSQIKPIGTYERSWPNPALGCPSPNGELVATVITPGYEIELEAAGQKFKFHTDMKNTVRLCPLAAAQENLADLLSLSPSQIRVTNITALEWNDANLGCANQGTAGAQVPTSGYLIELEAQGQRYEYHTDTAGIQAIRC